MTFTYLLVCLLEDEVWNLDLLFPHNLRGQKWWTSSEKLGIPKCLACPSNNGVSMDQEWRAVLSRTSTILQFFLVVLLFCSCGWIFKILFRIYFWTLWEDLFKLHYKHMKYGFRRDWAINLKIRIHGEA